MCVYDWVKAKLYINTKAIRETSTVRMNVCLTG